MRCEGLQLDNGCQCYLMLSFFCPKLSVGKSTLWTHTSKSLWLEPAACSSASQDNVHCHLMASSQGIRYTSSVLLPCTSAPPSCGCTPAACLLDSGMPARQRCWACLATGTGSIIDTSALAAPDVLAACLLAGTAKHPGQTGSESALGTGSLAVHDWLRSPRAAVQVPIDARDRLLAREGLDPAQLRNLQLIYKEPQVGCIICLVLADEAATCSTSSWLPSSQT